MSLTYVSSLFSASTRRQTLVNAAKACTYMSWAEKEFGDRAVAPHAYLPYLLDERVDEEHRLALDFRRKLMPLCSRLVVYGEIISAAMEEEISQATALGIPVYYRGGMKDAM